MSDEKRQDQGALSAPFVLEYKYKRTVGPIIGKFLTGLRDGKILAATTQRGPVVCPPLEYDPLTGDAITGLVELSGKGVIRTAVVVHKPLRQHPRQEPFAFALIQLDGADTAMTHIIVGDLARAKAGARVRAVFSPERVGYITDISHFEVEA